MKQMSNVINCYDSTAQEYAKRFGDELRHKHLDRWLLTAFAKENTGRFVDLGCGPGQTTKFLADHGVTDITGIDISPEMVAVAIKLYPDLNFEVGNILRLDYPDRSFSAAIAFYSIVHFTYDEITLALTEIRRILRDGGQLLFSFHIGDESIHLDEFLDKTVDINFNFFEVNKIMEVVQHSGFEVIDSIERAPYKDVEYTSRRAYIWIEKQPGS